MIARKRIDPEPPLPLTERAAEDAVTSVRLRWAALSIPLLALVAYCSVLGVGFLSDDFVLLYQGQQSGIDHRIFVPQPHWYLYRPLGTMLVWQVGWQLWGFNPFPFHLQSLILHALASLLLSLWVYRATGRFALGWLVGALFAVFPLHLEAVAWVAAQWDTLAVFLGLLSLWSFTVWWTRSGRFSFFPYLVSVLAYGLAIFAKESMIAFLPVFAVSAWLSSTRFDRSLLLRLGVGLLPFILLLGINVGLRLASWGHLGGYARTPLDLGVLFPIIWDQLFNYGRFLLAPLNRSIFGDAFVTSVAYATGIALLVGLARYGWANRRVLTVAAIWMGVALLPVLSLPLGTFDLQNNRFLYLASGGYALLMASLLYSLIATVRYRALGVLLIAFTIVCGVFVNWVQLIPWQAATTQVASLERDLIRMIPPWSMADKTTWYVQNPPDNYKGAYMLRLGLGGTRYFMGVGNPTTQPITDVTKAPLANTQGNAFAIRFDYDGSRYATNYVAGVTAKASPPSDVRSLIWDFRGCSPGVVGAWRVISATATCAQDRGLLVETTGNDPQIIATGLPAATEPSDRPIIRFRAGLTVWNLREAATDPHSAQWYWRSPEAPFQEAVSQVVPLRADQEEYTYWALASLAESAQVSDLRFDPLNAPGAVYMHWIALDFPE